MSESKYETETRITIYVPLILIVREVNVFFMQAKHIIGDFEGFFQGVKTIVTPKLAKKSRPS
jgi:hypothetical protein